MFYSQRTVEVNIRPHLNVGRLEAIVVRLEEITFSLNCLEFDPVQVPVVDDLLIPLVEFFDLLLELVVFLVVGIEPKIEHEYKNCKDHS